MKNIFKYILISIFTISIVGCETEEKVIDFVNENTEAGAILRQVSVTGLLDLFDTLSIRITTDHLSLIFKV
jgi:hypothetical protein